MEVDVNKLIAAFPAFVEQFETASISRTVVGTGSGSLTLTGISGQYLQIQPGNYSFISIENSSDCDISGAGVTLDNGNIELKNTTNTVLSGINSINNTYRAVRLLGLQNGLTIKDSTFSNIVDYVISYEADNVKYDGTTNTCSTGITLENIIVDNALTFFSSGGGPQADGFYSLIKGLTIRGCVVKNCPNVGSVVFGGCVEDYLVEDNIIDNINTVNNNHNGIFLMKGNGIFRGNTVTNHQGNAIRAWLFSITKPSSVEIYNNKVWNSRKYGAFELQVTPDIKAMAIFVPATAKVYNNTAGHLDTTQDWMGEMLDLYNTYSSVNYYNNLGFEMYTQDPTYHPITDMVNGNYDPSLTTLTSQNNSYFPTQAQAVVDTNLFSSLIAGVGAQ